MKQITLLLAALLYAAPQPVTFTDITSKAGIQFTHNSGRAGKKFLPETMGSGCAFLDADGDGWPDILLINSTTEHSPTSPPAAAWTWKCTASASL